MYKKEREFIYPGFITQRCYHRARQLQEQHLNLYAELDLIKSQFILFVAHLAWNGLDVTALACVT